MANDILSCYEWEPSDPTFCAGLTKYINETMIAFDAPFLFCRFCREAYTVDLRQKDTLKNEIERFFYRNKDADVKYAGTDDVAVTVPLSQKQFAEAAKLLLRTFMNCLLQYPAKMSAGVHS